MATKIRPELSIRNKYRIDKHRHYELKHFCLQYPEWKKAYASIDDSSLSLSMIENMYVGGKPSDLTAKRAMLKAYYSEKINLIEKTAMETDLFLQDYILKAVTEELSYTYLKTKLEIPCSRDTYYDRYRKFFWLLNEARN